ALSVLSAPTRITHTPAAWAGAIPRGGKLIWTLHNKLPHEVEYRDEEIALTEFLLDRASRVHILSAGTEIAVADVMRIPPDKITLIKHSSYVGVYDQSLSRESARGRFGVGADDFAVLFFGQMRPYKGLDTLLGAAALAQAKGKQLVVLMAGKTKPEEIEGIEALIPADVRVVREYSYVDDENTQDWFRAADIAVFPYRDILNSGSVHLAATFGLPTALPAGDHVLRQFGDQEWVRFFDRADAVASLAEIFLDTTMSEPHRRASAEAYADEFTPYDMAREMLSLIREVADSPQRPRRS
ncbi:MAG: glycosyltransferase, partial [Cryobacterium sp.]|nr:glycosyltransferase [Cryobacterium sp.]